MKRSSVIWPPYQHEDLRVVIAWTYRHPQWILGADTLPAPCWWYTESISPTCHRVVSLETAAAQVPPRTTVYWVPGTDAAASWEWRRAYQALHLARREWPTVPLALLGWDPVTHVPVHRRHRYLYQVEDQFKQEELFS